MKVPRSRKPRRPRQQVPPEAARSESRRVDFKESLDVASPGEWVELIKDVVTMANSGGGRWSSASTTTAPTPEPIAGQARQLTHHGPP